MPLTDRSGQTSHKFLVRGFSFVLRHHLTTFVLMIAYGLPALCGPSLHLFHACSSHECSLSRVEPGHSCRHCHHHTQPRPSTPPRVDSPGHDSSNCAVCKHHRMTLTQPSVVRVIAVVELLSTLAEFQVAQPESAIELLLLARGPPC